MMEKQVNNMIFLLVSLDKYWYKCIAVGLRCFPCYWYHTSLHYHNYHKSLIIGHVHVLKFDRFNSVGGQVSIQFNDVNVKIYSNR